MNQLFPKLYARGNNGQILEWEIEVVGNKFRTITGAQSAKKVESDWTIVFKGKNIGKKNETTPEKQAELEAKSRWDKKQKSGGYWLDIKDIDVFKFVEPMLAETYEDYSHNVDFTNQCWGVQTKYNGICCLFTKNGPYSRKGEKFIAIPHIEEALKEFFKQYPQAVLHGELFNDDLRQRLNEIVKLCRKTKHVTEEDLKKSKELVKYYIYDGYFPDESLSILSKDAEYVARKNFIDTCVVNAYDYCEKVETLYVTSKDELDAIFKTKIERGDEGLILRKMNMKYEHRRSQNLLKYKPENDDEGTILEIIEGDGNWSGAAKTATVEWRNGLTFNATFKGKYEDLVDVLKNPSKWVNKQVTFLHIGYTGKAVEGAPDGLPFSPRIDIYNCFKGDR